MLKVCVAATAFSIVLLALTAGAAHAQNYPTRPIRVVASAAGGGSDFILRSLSQGISENLGQPVIIENRGGGASAIEVVARAQPDGYTLLYYGSDNTYKPLITMCRVTWI